MSTFDSTGRGAQFTTASCLLVVLRDLEVNIAQCMRVLE